MLGRALVTLSILGGAWAQSEFEPADFNVTEALLQKGIDVSSIPALAGLVERSSPSACSIACSSLQTIFGDHKVITQQSASYGAFTNSYWSVQQASVDPYCIFKPTSVTDVSAFVLISRLTQCQFAVKSGGHAAFSGASNIQGGITVALEKMKDITLSSDKKVASIGPGNLWYDVYTRLEKENLTVIGGRVAAIGVGGLTLGGGISFFSNRYGWACDNVASFEVVTASGIILTASPTKYSDLYWALRGGGNNFGIVTKFNLETISQGQMWGGSRAHLETEFPAVIDAFVNLGMNAETDVDAAQILSFASAQGMKIAAADIQYAKPVDNAPIFSEYLAIPNPIVDNTRVRSLSDLTVQFNASNPNGLREMYWTATYKLDKEMVTFIKDVFYEELASIADAASLVPAATLQVITKPQLANMAKHGGNPLGLSPEDGNLLLLDLNTMWSNPADDERILSYNKRVYSRTVEEAKRRQLGENYLYMNYASQYQAVVPSYGEANQQMLQKIAAKYDPTRVFERLQPGYFKLDGAPAGTGSGGA
ncbi:FAD binding domain-containing protein [Delitschia confertaspora ATCC 74209]|uniref:FAD binding domain-containing protein n=1 Tax=Delitschia confertaspora ATCC 74209 TaxID=1513339 RepID=A0A9P4JMA4_9PLEO|nr:FAD binding domain-containing protein [Delitschia confertaspora ATCC 74209]